MLVPFSLGAQESLGVHDGLAPQAPGAVVDTVLDKVKEVQKDTKNIRSKVADIPGAVQDKLGIPPVDGELRDTIMGVFEGVQTMLQDQKEGLDDFNCPVFQKQLKKIIRYGGGNLNSVLGDNGTLPLGPILTAINLAPCPLLFVMSRAMDAAGVRPGILVANMKNSKVFFDWVINQMAENESETTQSVVQQTNGVLILPVGFDCYSTYEYRADIGRTANLYFLEGMGLKLLGKAMEPDSRFKFLPKSEGQDVGIHGYAGMSISAPKVDKAIAAFIGMYGDMEVGLAGFAYNKVNRCTQLAATCQGQNPKGEVCTDEGF